MKRSHQGILRHPHNVVGGGNPRVVRPQAGEFRSQLCLCCPIWHQEIICDPAADGPRNFTSIDLSKVEYRSVYPVEAKPGLMCQDFVWKGVRGGGGPTTGVFLICGVTWVLLTYWSCASRQTRRLKMLWGSGPKEKYLTTACTTLGSL